MQSANIAITLEELSIIIANDRGYSVDPTKWNANQTFVINQIVTSGVAQVYSPPPVNGEKVSPDWTFLKPITQISLPCGMQTIRMPDDFGSVDGPIAVQTSTQTGTPWWIDWKNENFIYQMYQTNPQITGPPKFAAETVLRNINPPAGQARGLVFFPIPDQDYLLQVKYSIIPERLSGSQPYTYGGPRFRELFIASCLAYAEQKFDNNRGVMTARFNEMLMAAVSEDNKNRPQKLGYNGNSEGVAWRGFMHTNPLAFYYNGQPIT